MPLGGTSWRERGADEMVRAKNKQERCTIEDSKKDKKKKTQPTHILGQRIRTELCTE